MAVLTQAVKIPELAILRPSGQDPWRRSLLDDDGKHTGKILLIMPVRTYRFADLLAFTEIPETEHASFVTNDRDRCLSSLSDGDGRHRGGMADEGSGGGDRCAASESRQVPEIRSLVISPCHGDWPSAKPAKRGRPDRALVR